MRFTAKITKNLRNNLKNGWNESNMSSIVCILVRVFRRAENRIMQSKKRRMTDEEKDIQDIGNLCWDNFDINPCLVCASCILPTAIYGL